MNRTILATVLLLGLAGTARGVPWPLDNVNQVHQVMQSYGQWQEEFGGIHLHEGIDLPTAADTDVLAVKKGKVVAIYVHPTDEYYNSIDIADDDAGNWGWGYVHVKAKVGLALGDTVNPGDVIGKVTSTDGIPAHLHLERDSDANGGWPKDGGSNDEHLLDDPMIFLNPRTDITTPTIDGLKFRKASDEGNDATPAYFTSEDIGHKIILGSRAATGASGNVDVLASAFDKFGEFTDKLGVHDITFHSIGRLGDATFPLQRQVKFEGQFAQQETNNFTDLFRNADFAQTIYENDTVANSSQAGPFWYIVTNQDDDSQPEIGDADWFWNTDGDFLSRWNGKASTDDRAANNARGSFRDDFYDIYINVSDEANNNNFLKQTILLDNWEQKVEADKVEYNLNQMVKVQTGEQHQRSDTALPIYVVGVIVQDILPITDLGVIAGPITTTTDNQGVIQLKNIWQAGQTGTFYLLSDYDHDGIFHPLLDAYDSFKVVPEPATGCVLMLSALLLFRRRR